MFFAGLTYGPGRFKPVWVIYYAYESDFPQEFGHFLYYMKLSTCARFFSKLDISSGWLTLSILRKYRSTAARWSVARHRSQVVTAMFGRVFDVILSRSEEIQVKKLRQRSKQSPEDK